MERIRVISKKNVIDRSNSVLQNFWEIRNDINDAIEKDIKRRIIELITNAREMIIIRTKVLSDLDINSALKDAWFKNIRVYGVLTNEQKPDLLDFGIFHISNRIYSSYILIDPNTSKAKGLWWDTWDLERVRLSFELEVDMVRELWGHLSQEFWSSQRAIYIGKVKDGFKADRKPPQLPESLKLTARNITPNFLQNVRHIYIPENIIINPEILKNLLLAIDSSETISVPFKEISRKIVKSALEYGKEVHTCILPSGFALSESEGVLFMPDIMIRLKKTKALEILDRFKEIGKFYREKKIGEIKGKVVFYNADWDDISSQLHVEEEKKVLSPILISCNTIDDWLKHEEIELKVPPDDKLPIAKKIYITYEVHPPYLPENAQKHPIYSEWADYISNFKKVLNQIKSECNRISRTDLPSAKKIALETRLASMRNEIDKIESEINNCNMKKLQASNAEKKMRELIAQLSDIDEDYKKDINEEPNELEFVVSKKNDNKKLSDLLKILKQIPETVPEVGKLYVAGHRNYLAIETVEEIEQAKKESQRFNAIICVKKEGRV